MRRQAQRSCVTSQVFAVEPVVVGTNILFIVGASSMLGFYGWRSWQNKRIQPMLIFTLAIALLTWMEAPYNWGIFLTYNPGFSRIPGWGGPELAGLSDGGPFGLTHGGLAWVAVPGYPFYFVIPLVISVGVAKRVALRRRASFPKSLLIVGFATGFLWDMGFEMVATRTGLYRFSHVPWGLGLFEGEVYQTSLGTSLAAGVFLMGCAYLFGRVDDQGDDPLRRWARRRAGGNRAAGVVHFASTVLALHLLYAGMLLPHLATNAFGLTTEAAKRPIFEGVLNQASPSPHAGPLGFAIIVGAAAACFSAAYWLVGRYDPEREELSQGHL